MKLPEVAKGPVEKAKFLALLELKLLLAVARIGIRAESELTKQFIFWIKFWIKTDVEFARFVTTVGLESAGKLILAWLLERRTGNQDASLHDFLTWARKEDELNGVSGSHVSFSQND